MLGLQQLHNVTTLVCHRNADKPCPDGVASALILRDVLPDAAVRFVSHGPELENLEARPGMLFCDITPSAVHAEDFVSVDAIVLDHHRTARSIVELFGPLGVFADENHQPGVSGALLAFREVWMPLAYRNGQRPATHATEGQARDEVERVATLAGVRDTWLRTSERWEEACAQAEALVFWPFERWPYSFAEREEFGRMMAIGKVLLQKRAQVTLNAIRSGWRFTTEKGTRVVVVSTLETSDVADALDQTVDLVVGFGYRIDTSSPKGAHTERMVLSLRSHTTFDCGAFCAANQGGGHTRAAGCSFELASDDPQPYTCVSLMLECWEQGGRGAVGFAP